MRQHPHRSAQHHEPSAVSSAVQRCVELFCGMRIAGDPRERIVAHRCGDGQRQRTASRAASTSARYLRRRIPGTAIRSDQVARLSGRYSVPWQVVLRLERISISRQFNAAWRCTTTGLGSLRRPARSPPSAILRAKRDLRRGLRVRPASASRYERSAARCGAAAEGPSYPVRPVLYGSARFFDRKGVMPRGRPHCCAMRACAAGNGRDDRVGDRTAFSSPRPAVLGVRKVAGVEPEDDDPPLCGSSRRLRSPRPAP